MGFQTAIATCFRKYVTFSGRASRPEYWWFVLFILLGNIAAAAVDAVIFGVDVVETSHGPGEYGVQAESDGPIAALFSLVVFVPSLSAGWRRMHDSGRSGLHLIYPLIVMVGIGMAGSFFGGMGALMSGAIGGLAALVFGVALIVLIISPLLVLWWLTRPSQPGANQYGPNPAEVAK
jgi:uncharacterized membrane protein YhaH (DUF805 family)